MNSILISQSIFTPLVTSKLAQMCHGNYNNQYQGVAMEQNLNACKNKFTLLYGKGNEWGGFKGGEDNPSFYQFKPNRFYHVVYVMDARQQTYVDGELQYTASEETTYFPYQQTHFYLGTTAYQSDVGARIFDGVIADFRVYNSALNSAQIRQLFLSYNEIYNASKNQEQPINWLQSQLEMFQSDVLEQNKVLINQNEKLHEQMLQKVEQLYKEMLQMKDEQMKQMVLFLKSGQQ